MNNIPLWVLGFVGALILIALMYIYLLKDWFEYRQAKRDIFIFVKSYRRRCTGNNRFVVTVESLQDSFREYNTTVITRVWLDLVTARMIEPDPNDQVWCVR